MYVLWWFTVDANLVLSPPFCRNKKSSEAECDFENFKSSPLFDTPPKWSNKVMMHDPTKQMVRKIKCSPSMYTPHYKSPNVYVRRVWDAAKEMLVVNSFNGEA